MRLMRRIAAMLLTVWLAATLVFFALRVLPGDAIQNSLLQAGASAQVIEEHRQLMGLTDSVPVQYARFLIRALQGDLGHSLLTREPVTLMVARVFPHTFALAIGALTIASGLGVVIGLVSALELRWGVASITQIITSISLSTPIYWTGTLALYFFTVQLRILPSAGSGRLSHLVLPVMVLGFHTAGAIARVIQVNVQEILRSDFVQVARSKGLGSPHILIHHVLRAGLAPAVSVIALQAGFLFSGTVIIETIFVRPGIGRLLLNSTIQQDYPVVQGIVILSVLIYTSLNILADFVHAWLDPRINVDQ
jgi:ABC-type dipeptide/oligopeptide/nickel transport system permease component